MVCLHARPVLQSETLLVLFGLHLGYDPFQNSPCLTHGKVTHVIILRCKFDQPFSLDVCHCSDVVLRSQHKLVIKHPLWLVVKTRRRMKLDNLVVLYSQVMTSALEVSYLHKEPSNESLPYVDVVVSTREICTGTTQVKAIHDACQLLSYVVCALQRTEVDEVIITPLRIFMVLFESMVDVQQCQVVAINVSESHLALVGCLLHLHGTNKTLWN